MVLDVVALVELDVHRSLIEVVEALKGVSPQRSLFSPFYPFLLATAGWISPIIFGPRLLARFIRKYLFLSSFSFSYYLFFILFMNYLFSSTCMQKVVPYLFYFIVYSFPSICMQEVVPYLPLIFINYKFSYYFIFFLFLMLQ